jgi:hypothetical protein
MSQATPSEAEKAAPGGSVEVKPKLFIYAAAARWRVAFQ